MSSILWILSKLKILAVVLFWELALTVLFLEQVFWICKLFSFKFLRFSVQVNLCKKHSFYSIELNSLNYEFSTFCIHQIVFLFCHSGLINARMIASDKDLPVIFDVLAFLTAGWLTEDRETLGIFSGRRNSSFNFTELFHRKFWFKQYILLDCNIFQNHCI